MATLIFKERALQRIRELENPPRPPAAEQAGKLVFADRQRCTECEERKDQDRRQACVTCAS